jgi:hypothetical protein
VHASLVEALLSVVILLGVVYMLLRALLGVESIACWHGLARRGRRQCDLQSILQTPRHYTMDGTVRDDWWLTDVKVWKWFFGGESELIADATTTTTGDDEEDWDWEWVDVASLD